MSRFMLPIALVLAAPAAAALDQRQLDTAVARPAAGATLPSSLIFTDQHGARVTLGQVQSGRPLVLLFADYTCRHICGPGATLTAVALRQSGLTAGQDYSFAIVGIDPRDGVDAARAFARRPDVASVAGAARMLVGSAASVAAAMRALGYHAVYDPGTDQFAHDASVYVFDRTGHLTTLLPELGTQPETMRAAIAGVPAQASLGERIARLCYGLDAAHGRYGRAIGVALQALAVLTVIGLAGLVWRRRAA